MLVIGSFTIRSNETVSSEPITITGATDAKGHLSHLDVFAFNKNTSVPENILKQIPIFNGLCFSHEAGYSQTGGKTLYILFQTGFTSGGVRGVYLVVKENGSIELMNKKTTHQ